MRLTKTLFFMLTALAFSGLLRAQDLHNTLFYMNPLHMNPAFTGAYEGTYRIGGIYRDQYRSVVTNAYSTPSFYIDAPILMIGKRHWIGVGGLMFQDVAGTGKLKTTGYQIAGSFHAALDKKSDNVLTLGVQWGQVQRSLGNARGLLFQDMIELEAQTTTDNVLSNGKDPKKSFTDINAGLLFKSKLSKESDFNMGVSIRHITTPDHNFRGGAGDLPMRITAHGQYNTSLNGKWSLTPEVYYSSISNSRQFQLHGWTGYQLKPDIRLNGGLGYRFGDAGQVLLGMDYKDFKFALGYDVTLSELGKVNSHQGGFEVALSYIGKIYKKPVVKPAVLCPHL